MEKLQESLVKGVLSGDTVIISGKISKNSDEAPEEKTLYLSLISAPRCASSNNLEEEAYGWDSRDHLRQKVLGKVVKYTIDYKNNDKVYGQIYLEGKNMNLDLVKNGYAKIGFVPKGENISKGEYFTKLQTSENEAKKNKLNIWSADQTELASHRRKLNSVNDLTLESAEILKFASGKQIDVMVDYIINCASYVILIKEINYFIKMNLRFIGIPNSRDNALYKGGKAYAERLVLHKDIKAVIYGTDGDKSFIGDLIDKKGSIANFILRNGHSKLFINSNTPYSADELNTMKQEQKSAKKLKLRIWKNERDSDDDEETTDDNKNIGGKSDKVVKKAVITDFEGVCVQVHSGDSLSVKSSTGEVIRIFLSHLKAPKLAKPNSEETDAPWAWQAKEFLRKILVGKNVRCEIDYTKKLEKDDKKMTFYSVFRPIESKENKNKENVETAPKEKNVNVELIEIGYATYVSPKLDDDVSKYLDSYQSADKIAKDKKVGVYSIKYPGNPNYSDLIAANKAKKKDSINFLVNQKNLPCVVEYCFTGSKFKLRIEKTKSYVPFSLLGIKTFAKDKNTLELHDKFYKEALDFVNENILQREGVCDIIQADRVGNYFGYLTINGANFGTTLLKEGLGVISVQSNTPIIYMNDFKTAEKSAEQGAKNIWAHSNLAGFLKDGEVVSSLSNKFEDQHSDATIRVTDYIDFNNFYINILPNKNLEKIDSVLYNYETGKSKPVSLEFPVKLGTLCCARYTNDDKFYRAKILKTLKDDKFQVEFLDYGTVDECSKEDLMKLDNSIAMIEPQAVLCELAYLKYSQNSMRKALETVTNFVNIDLQLPAKICYRYNQDGKTKLGVFIYKKSDKKLSDTIHNTLLKVGYAKFDVKKTLPNYLQDLKEIEKKADDSGIGIWAENEVADYDEEEEI
jgi:staphylococcal nuclease domain-containing protein 1